MKDRFENNVHVRGWVFDFQLAKRTTSANAKTPNVNFITGTVYVAVDKDAINVVPVAFGFFNTQEHYKNGKENETYKNLLEMMEPANEGRTVKNSGIENAMQVRIDGRITTNDFMTRSGEVASPKQLSGTFLHFVRPNEELVPCAEFSADALIQSAAMREGASGDEYMELKGFVFDFGGRIYPVTLSVPGEAGQQFFESQEVSTSNPYFGKVWGVVNTSVQKIEREVDTSNVGFGEVPEVEYSTRTLRTWDVEGANINLGLSDDTITMDELKVSMEYRQKNLAYIRERWEEQNNNGAQSQGFGAASPVVPASKVATKKKATTDDDDFEF